MYKHFTISKKAAFTELILFFLAICIFSISGFISIPLPFSPVPIVIQVNIAILYGALFGSRRAVALLLSSYFISFFGFPMFAGGAGATQLLSPTAGYLVGYILAAFAMGKLVKDKSLSSLELLYYFNLANLVVYACGLPVLSCYIGWKKAFIVGLFPFMPGMILKNVFMTKICSKIGRL